ncbi:MAG: nuclear transport factor 2 family protein [Acidimicrobiales bacterium]
MHETFEPTTETVHREAIRDLVARYNAYGDSGKFDLLLALFTPTAAMEIHGSEGARRFE